MIDFVKIYYKDKTKLEPYAKDANNFNEIEMVLEGHSGEIRYPYRVKHENMNLVLSDKSGYVRNSIHKLNNIVELGEDHNHNDFNYSKLCSTIDYLSRTIIDSTITGLTHLEFGLNINLNKPAEGIIRGNILMHSLKNYNHNRKYYGKGELKQFDHHNYFIKVYDKAKQYELDSNILRFEVKFIKAVEFQNLGIFCLEDLKSKINLRRLFVYLIKRFDELTIVDDYHSNTTIPNKDIELLNKFTNPVFWSEHIKEQSRTMKGKHKRRFEAILERHDLLKTKMYLKTLLLQKFIFLINN